MSPENTAASAPRPKVTATATTSSATAASHKTSAATTASNKVNTATTINPRSPETHAYRNLSDERLLTELQAAIACERQATQDVLYLLHEVERRHLHLKRGYSSLFSFLTQELNYSEGSAQRRIQAMRLLKSVGPELGEKIEEDLRSGALSLSTACTAQSVFQRDKTFTTAQSKLDLLEALKGKSRMEVQREIITKSPVAAAALESRSEKQRVVTPDLTELKLYVDRQTLDTLTQLQLLLSHQLTNPRSYSELLAKIAEMALQRLSSKQKGKRSEEHRPSDAAQSPALKPAKSSMHSKSPERPQAPALHSSRQPSQSQQPSRYIPAAIRQAVLARDENCCSYQDPLTSRVCRSKYKLELDHQLPFALGGEATVENLRVRCHNHNAFHAAEVFGPQHRGPRHHHHAGSSAAAARR